MRPLEDSNYMSSTVSVKNKEACNSLGDAAQANCTENKETINSENVESESSLNKLRSVTLC